MADNRSIKEALDNYEIKVYWDEFKIGHTYEFIISNFKDARFINHQVYQYLEFKGYTLQDDKDLFLKKNQKVLIQLSCNAIGNRISRLIYFNNLEEGEVYLSFKRTNKSRCFLIKCERYTKE